MTGRIGYNHPNACREGIKAEMQTDPEYRRCVHRHEPHHEAGHVEILIAAQFNERRHNIQKAINVFERKARSHTGGGGGGGGGLGTTMRSHYGYTPAC